MNDGKNRDVIQLIIFEAIDYSQESLLKKYSHYEFLKSKLTGLDITHQDYQKAIRQIADALQI